MIIQDATVYYENIKVKINGEWVFLKSNDLKGINIKGRLVTKRTRTWLEPEKENKMAKKNEKCDNCKNPIKYRLCDNCLCDKIFENKVRAY